MCVCVCVYIYIYKPCSGADWAPCSALPVAQLPSVPLPPATPETKKHHITTIYTTILFSMRFEGGRVRTTCWSRTTTHTMATLDTRGLVEAPIWFVVFLLLCVAIPVLHDLHGTQCQFRRKERSVDKRERGRNGEGATTRAACRGGKPSCAVSSSIGPSSRSRHGLLQRSSPSETSWTTLTDPADSHRLAETLADSAHAYSHHCAHRYARGVVVYVP